MTSDPIDPRAELLARRDAALVRWPRRCGAEFAAEMTAIAEEFLALAQAAEFCDAEPGDRFRAWLHAGDAYFAFGTARDSMRLKCAADAYRMAEALLDEADTDAVERVSLLDSHGRALLQLAEDDDVELASAAAHRLATALSLARQHIPERVAGIKLELCRAEHVIAVQRNPDALRTLVSESVF
jgi:hypothetical protein